VPLETPEQVLTVLTQTPRRLAVLTRAVDPGRLDRRPSPEAWSAAEVLAHLRSCADVWGECIARILAQDRPTIRAVNPRTYLASTDYASAAFDVHLMAFTRQRAELLDLLHELPPEAWRRSAVVTGAGRPLERTVLSYATWLASHERPHVRQVDRAAGG
jgi:hypothetical protein